MKRLVSLDGNHFVCVYSNDVIIENFNVTWNYFFKRAKLEITFDFCDFGDIFVMGKDGTLKYVRTIGKKVTA